PAALPAFPTRRSSDLVGGRGLEGAQQRRRLEQGLLHLAIPEVAGDVGRARLVVEEDGPDDGAEVAALAVAVLREERQRRARRPRDRKSTRLNSSHDQI